MAVDPATRPRRGGRTAPGSAGARARAREPRRGAAERRGTARARERARRPRRLRRRRRRETRARARRRRWGRTAGRDATSGRSSVVPRSADGDGPATASRHPARRSGTGARATAGVSPAPPALLRRPEPEPPRSSEPILIPKLRIGFADFPYLHYSMRLEAAHLGDLLRISVRTDAKTPRGPLSNFQGPRGGHGHRRNERCSSRSRPYRPAKGFQGRTTLTEKRELFPDPPAASSSSFRLPGRDKRAPNTRERFRVGFRNTDRIPSRPMGDS